MRNLEKNEELRFMVRDYVINFDGCEMSAANEYVYSDYQSARDLYDALNPRADWKRENEIEWLRLKTNSKEALDTNCVEVREIVYNTDDCETVEYGDILLYKDYGAATYEQERLIDED